MQAAGSSKAFPFLPNIASVDTRVVRKSVDKDGNKQVNQYTLLELLGKGAYGKVRRCESCVNGEQYAVKILNKSLLKRKRIDISTTAFHQVMREVALMKKIKHPNCVRLYEVIDCPEDDKLYLVMELMRGGTLKPQTGSQLDERRLAQQMFDAVLGIEYLHQQNIIHRDIKPDNLLLSEDGVVKVADFGLAELQWDGSDLVTTMYGTPAFMAPEMRTQGPASGRANDMWSLGVTLFYLAFGMFPFEQMSVYDVRPQHGWEFPRHREITHELKDLLQRLLDPVPESRATVRQTKHHAWFQRYYLLQTTTSLLPIQASVTSSDVQSAISVFDQSSRLARLKRNMVFQTIDQSRSKRDVPIKRNERNKIQGDEEEEKEEEEEEKEKEKRKAECTSFSLRSGGPTWEKREGEMSRSIEKTSTLFANLSIPDHISFLLQRKEELEGKQKRETETTHRLMKSLQAHRRKREQLEKELIEARVCEQTRERRQPVFSNTKEKEKEGQKEKKDKKEKELKSDEVAFPSQEKRTDRILPPMVGDSHQESSTTSHLPMEMVPLTSDRRPRVLIVDDDIVVRKLLRLKLKKVFECELAKDGEEGLEMFFRFQPDVVLLDLQMPKKDGYEVCEEIRKVSSVPILLMTAMEHADTRKKGIQIGADSFITKPFSPIDVDARLRAFLRTTDKRGGYPVESPHWSREMSIHLSLQEVHKCLHVMKTAMSTFRKAISHMKTNKFCASSTDAREIWRDIKKDVTETNWILSTSRMEKDM